MIKLELQKRGNRKCRQVIIDYVGAMAKLHLPTGILQEKRDLFETILSGPRRHPKLGFTQDELFGLFDLNPPDGSLDRAA